MLSYFGEYFPLLGFILQSKPFVQYDVCSHIVQRFLYLVCHYIFFRFLGDIWWSGWVQLLTEAVHCNLPCHCSSFIGLFNESCFLIFVCLMFILFWCSFGFRVLTLYLAGLGNFNGFKSFWSNFVEASWVFRICFEGLCWRSFHQFEFIFSFY